MPALVGRDSIRSALIGDLRHLTSEGLDGRAAGFAGSDSAAVYLARRFYDMRLDPAFIERPCAPTGCQSTFLQPFGLSRDLMLRFLGPDASGISHNVAALIRGTDPSVADQWIIVGAHFDHLGRTGLGSRDRNLPKRLHYGADDNASGTAAVLALAQRLADEPLRRPVMITLFGAEEIGLVGSRAFVARPPHPLDSAAAMVNLDMVGRLRRGRIEAFGLASSADWASLLARAGAEGPLRVTPHEEPGRADTGSDHLPFQAEGIPAIHLTTGTHGDWHTGRDTFARLVPDGIMQVVDYTERLLRTLDGMDRAPRRPGR